MKNYAGSATLTLEKVDGESFDAVYTTEIETWQWRVHGTVNSGKIRWGFVQPLKTKGKDDATGKAFVEGSLSGNRITGFYRSRTAPNEVAEITLQFGK